MKKVKSKKAEVEKKHSGADSIVNSFSVKERTKFNDLYEVFAPELLKLAKIHAVAGTEGKRPTAQLRNFIDVGAHNLAVLAVKGWMPID